MVGQVSIDRNHTSIPNNAPIKNLEMVELASVNITANMKGIDMDAN